MTTIGYPFALLAAAALLAGCENRRPVIVESELRGRPLTEIVGSAGSAAPGNGPTIDPMFTTERIETPRNAADPGSPGFRLPDEADWAHLSNSTAGMTPRDGDILFAGLTPAERKKSTPFERELRAGLDALSGGRGPEAIEHFEAAERAEPRDFRPYFFEAVVRLQQDSVPRAAAALDIAIGLAPNEMELYLHRGNLRLRQRDFGLAVDDFSRVIAAHPQHLSALLNRAAANFHRRRPKDVVADASAVIKISSAVPDAYLLRALGYLMQGETVLARRDYDSAVKGGLGKSAAESWGPLFRGRS